MQAINLPLASEIVAPAVNLPDQKGVINETVRFVLPVDTLTVVGPGSVVVCTLDLANGSSLPAWLRFNPDTTTVFADPGTADAGVYRLRLTVADGHGGAVDLHLR